MILGRFTASLKRDRAEAVSVPEFESVDPASLRCRWSRYSRPKSSGVELAFLERLNRCFRCTLGHLEPSLGGFQ